MSSWKRWILALFVLAVDLLLFFIPLTALFLVYILVFNPSWFREFLERSHSREINEKSQSGTGFSP